LLIARLLASRKASSPDESMNVRSWILLLGWSRTNGRRDETSVVSVRIEGESPLAEFGSDTDREGAGLFDEQRLYQLVRQNGPVVDRTFEIEFLDAGSEAFAFTGG
jgi:hypothetical protein